VYSLNVPLPSDVPALATELARELPRARARTRGEHTLVLKRLGTGDRGVFQRRRERTREALAGAPAVDARVAGVDYFETPATGPAPVVYLAVESPGLEALHARLCERFDPVEGIEGDEYRTHVTIARGGAIDAAKRLTRRDVDPIEWTVSALHFFDADRGQRAGRLSLPA
jgi:2'-5' RNA ligase